MKFGVKWGEGGCQEEEGGCVVMDVGDESRRGGV